jgi:hypothetical protein
MLHRRQPAAWLLGAVLQTPDCQAGVLAAQCLAHVVKRRQREPQHV